MERRKGYVEWTDDRLDILLAAVDAGVPIKRLLRRVGISNDRCVIKIADMGLKAQYRLNRETLRGTKSYKLSPQTEAWEKLRF